MTTSGLSLAESPNGFVILSEAKNLINIKDYLKKDSILLKK